MLSSYIITKMFSRLNPPSDYYVYAYLRENGSPYYVGKGQADRAWVVHHRGKKGVRRPALNHPERIVIISYGLTELWSLALERRLIKWYGRKDQGTGILLNKTDGGDGPSGYRWSSEQRKRKSITQVGSKNNFFGKNHSMKTKEKWNKNPNRTRVGTLNTFFGKTHTEKTKKVMSILKEGSNNPMHGRKQNRCSCIGCHKETSINALMAYHKDCLYQNYIIT